MPSACGVSWDGTSSGKLDESGIPNDDYESHYLNDGDTKSSSSFPVVDGSGNLRAGNVRSAWKLRGQGEGVGESCLRKLANAFDETPLPENAYENSEPIKLSDLRAISYVDVDADDTYAFSVSLQSPVDPADGFNEHGVRVNDDGSVDVRFDAMEPGVRRGVDVTNEFLDHVASKTGNEIPLQLDHSASQRANVGRIDPGNIQFNGERLQVQAHIPNTGSTVRDDVIADFTHDPPQIQDISIAFDPQSVEMERPPKRGEPPKFTDADIREFSLTPFPAGYERGGLTAAFSEAVGKLTNMVGRPKEQDDSPEEPTDFRQATNHLVTRPHKLIKQSHNHD